ncbi:putative spermidine/putrescine transport system substrate-binding protein [Tepidamorphus gemmatus]|uniref:Putative spermidine/putrescine transport system substrate-binding protein n=1 Tax=Tepidamorphus gemmatus TaxID=747076 RepID=A0A4V2UYF3_9HYPH|nr:extracellular solute-binding protein [Tepidamorphus gemmatus]TCT07158.1 putative spermidine/putrescine transport system substrate-binding protein [Tepidamorphus gemmatus]
MTRPFEPRSPNLNTAGRPRLRVLGTEITLLEIVRDRAAADLGIDLQFEVLDFLSAQHKAAVAPTTYDVYDQCFHNLDIVWFWRAIQPIELDRITRWDAVSDLTKTGRISPNAPVGSGDAPVTRLFVQPNGSLGAAPTHVISMLPTVHNFDSFAYLPTAVNGGPEAAVSWGDLLDERWSGRVALVDEPAIGIFDAALAAQARGEMSFEDIGNLTIEEIDRLIDLLETRKRAGHFHGFWRTAHEAADFMASGAVAIASMWSPGITELRERGVDVVEAVPIEGYRAWHGGVCLARHLSGRMLDVAYDYLNWWLDGWAGAMMARQGYYMSVTETVKAHLSPAEWAYWYEGEVAATDLPDPQGIVTVRAGEVRAGGSYRQRASRIAVWNTTMDEHNYLVRRWNKLVGRQSRDAADPQSLPPGRVGTGEQRAMPA